MARIRFKIELNPGGDGIRMDKLAKISGELEKFVKSLAADSGAEIKSGEWVARNFYNSSLGATVEYVGTVDPSVVAKFNTGLRFFSNFQKKTADRVARYSSETVNNFVKIGEVIDTDERIKIGLFDDPEDVNPDWMEINRSTTLLVDETVHQYVTWLGAIQGSMGTWFKEANSFNLKDAVHGNQVRCVYPARMYDEIYSHFKVKDAVVIVEGSLRSNITTGLAKEIKVSSITSTPRLSDDEFDDLLKGTIDLTGSSSTLKYIERRRLSDEF